MFFNSFQFVGFFFIVWIAIAILLRSNCLRVFFPSTVDVDKWAIRIRNTFIVAASYYFYSAWDWRFLGLIWVSTLVDYICGRLIDREYQKGSGARQKKWFVVLSITTNLGILGFFKYYDFFIKSTTALLSSFDLHPSIPLLKVVLPVGISFYTFQTLSYTIDVYRGRIRSEKSLLNFAAYVAFFPQLVAGPIERASSLLGQFSNRTTITREQLYTGFYLICSGMLKKVLIADNVSKLVDLYFGMKHPSAFHVVVGAYAFAIQIYCDFSGYTDIARGVARCLGFELRINFNLPYFSTNPSDFWRRWHISLSTWLRDYLYIPLGGNRKGTGRMYINLMTTMLLGGLWHGAAWTFVVWGLFHGILLCIYKLAEDYYKRFERIVPKWGYTVLKPIKIFVFFNLIAIGWIFFRANNIHRAWIMIKALGRGFDLKTAISIINTPVFQVSALVTVLLIAVQLLQYIKNDRWAVMNLPALIRAPVYTIGALLFMYVGEYGGKSFVYFQF